MQLLPHWCITDKHPAFFDTESATVIEMVAKLHGSMNTLIEEYNQFIDNCNEKITEFMNATDKNYEVFTTELRQEFQDFIDTVDLHIQSQDNKIDDAVKYMKDNIVRVTQTIVMSALANESIHTKMNYDAEEEHLEFVFVGED